MGEVRSDPPRLFEAKIEAGTFYAYHFLSKFCRGCYISMEMDIESSKLLWEEA